MTNLASPAARSSVGLTICAEQARIVALLVERVDTGTGGLNLRLRVDGLARELLTGGVEVAA